MYPRTEYEMTEDDLNVILAACKRTPVMMIGGSVGSSSQENANRAWATLGKKMGFKPMSVRPVTGKGDRFFTAIPAETPEQRAEREKREAAQARADHIQRLEQDIAVKTMELNALRRSES